MDASANELAGTLSLLLDEANYAEALSLPQDNRHEDAFKNGSWEIIPAVVAKVHDDTIIITPALYSTCEKLLSAITEKANPEEVLLEFLEQIESAKNDAQFLLVLVPLRNVLGKLKNKRNRSLEWCLNSISTYIETIPVPEHNLEGRERVLMDSDSNVRRIEKVYSHLPEFYGCFIDEVLQNKDCSTQSKQVVAAFLVDLLGKPLIHIDVEPENSGKSEARRCCQIIVNDICKLEKDILKLLSYVEYKYKEHSKENPRRYDDEPTEHYLFSEKLSITSLSGLFYAALSGDFELPEYALPQVYNPQYIVHTTLLAVVHLLSFTSYGSLTKGLSLGKAILARLSKPVSHELLGSTAHSKLIKSLVNVAVFSNYEKTRKDAVLLIGAQVNMFDYKGRTTLIKCLLDMANHSGIIGYAITLYKNSIDEIFRSQQTCPDCFIGTKFIQMLKKFASLPNGAESDLVELADQIITTLNFIIYLTQKDSANITGIRESFPYLEYEYLDKLRTGLNMSKAHYQVKLSDMEQGKHVNENKIDVSINVGGNVLDEIPLENQKQIVNSALNAFHLMESLVARVGECININKTRVL